MGSGSLMSSAGISRASPRRVDGNLFCTQSDQEHHRPLEPLGLVHGEHVHGRRLGVGLGHRRILARVDEGVEVVHELAHVVVAEHPGGVLDAAEELADVLDLLLARAGAFDIAGQAAGVHEELVEQLAGRASRAPSSM